MLSQRCLDLPRVGIPGELLKPVHTVVLMAPDTRGTRKAIGAGLLHYRMQGQKQGASCPRAPERNSFSGAAGGAGGESVSRAETASSSSHVCKKEV